MDGIIQGRAKPGAHLLRHRVSDQAKAAAAATFPGPLDDAGAAILQLRQPNLRQTFAEVFGVHTSSGNNDWMRGKLLQARGLNGKWRPEGQVPPTGSVQSGSPASSGKASAAQRPKRAPEPLQHDSAASVGIAAAGAQPSVSNVDVHGASGATGSEGAPKRTRPNPWQASGPATYTAFDSAAWTAGLGAPAAPAAPQVLVLVVSGDAHGASQQSPFACGGSASWQSYAFPSSDGSCLGSAAAPQPSASLHQQAAMAALQALGLPYGHATVVSMDEPLQAWQADAIAASMARGGSRPPSPPVPAPQAAPAAMSTGAHLQRSCSPPMQQTEQGGQLGKQHGLPTPFAGFWGGGAPAAAHAAPPAWHSYADNSLPHAWLASTAHNPCNLAPQPHAAPAEQGAVGFSFAGWHNGGAHAGAPGGARAPSPPAAPAGYAAVARQELSRAASSAAPPMGAEHRPGSAGPAGPVPADAGAFVDDWSVAELCSLHLSQDDLSGLFQSWQDCATPLLPE